MGLLGREDRGEATLLERQHVDAARLGIDTRGVAYNVDEPVKGMQAAEEIVVFAIGARQEAGEVAQADALQAIGAAESGNRMGILRTDAVDQNLVELAKLARARQRKRQHVPERKPEVIDQHLPARLRMPFGGVERGQQIVEGVRARVAIALSGALSDHLIEFGDLALT